MQDNAAWSWTAPNEMTRVLVEAINLPYPCAWEWTPLDDGTPCWTNIQTRTLTLRHPGNDDVTGLPPGWDFHCTQSSKILFEHRESNNAQLNHPGASNPPANGAMQVASQNRVRWDGARSSSFGSGSRISRQLTNNFPTINSQHTQAVWKKMKKAGRSKTAWKYIGVGLSTGISIAGSVVGVNLNGVGALAGNAVNRVGEAGKTRRSTVRGPAINLNIKDSLGGSNESTSPGGANDAASMSDMGGQDTASQDATSDTAYDDSNDCDY